MILFVVILCIFFKYCCWFCECFCVFGINLVIWFKISFGVNKKIIIVIFDLIKVVIIFVCLFIYNVIKFVLINKFKLIFKCFFFFNNLLSNLEKVRRLSWDKLDIFVKFNISFVIIFIVDFVVVFVINVNISIKYFVKICWIEVLYIN